MLWFHRLFPAAMFLWPAALVLCLRPHPTRALAEAPERSRRVLAATAVALLVHAVVRATIERSTSLPAFWGVGWTPFAATFGSMLLWFRFAVPALAARQPGWSAEAGVERPEARPGPSVRAASLEPRHRADPVPLGAWVAGWALCVLAAGASVWAILRGVSPALLAGLCFWLFAGPLGARASLLEPEPMDERGSPELREAYARLRALRSWGFFWFGLLGTLFFAGVAVATALEPRAAALAGGIGGAAFGLLGAAFGTLASLRRARIESLRQELGARPG